MINNIILRSKYLMVAQYEFLKVVRKPSFWLMTLFFPAFILVISFVSGYSAQSMEKQLEEDLAELDRILILDESGLINPAIYQQPPYVKVDELNSALDEVKSGKADGLFVYPEDIATSKEIRIHKIDNGLVQRGMFNGSAQALVGQSILLELGDPQKIELVSSSFNVDTTNYDSLGQPVEARIEDFIVPVISVVLYFLLIMLASNFLLMSVSEEKESRMMEILLSIMRSRDLVWGKIIGLTGVALTQLAVLVIAGGLIIYNTIDRFPVDIDLTTIQIDPVQTVVSVFYILAGFVIMAAVMVGVGAAAPSYKEAQSLSPIFIIGSIFPIYFASLIIQEPNGLISMITSYFPLTAPLILLSRNALGALPLWEAILSSFILVIYIIISFWLSFKLFEIGSLEYKDKLSFKAILGRNGKKRT